MVKGVNLLTALYHSQDVSLTVDFDLIQKTELVNDPKTGHDGEASVLYLVTSDLTLDGPAITALYQKRWKIEEYHKSIKSNAAFARSLTRRLRTQSNHFFASLVAFVKLEAYRATLQLNHFALRCKVYLAAIAIAYEQLQQLKATCPNAAITL